MQVLVLYRAQRARAPDAMETVDAFLTRLGLSCYASMLADEAITEVDLLRSMGEEILREVRA